MFKEYEMFKKALYEIRKIISKFKPSNIKKKKMIWKKLNPYFFDVKKQLTELGFRHIKPYSLKTWKCYAGNAIRLTTTCNFDNKKYIVKCGKGFDEKINNSIRFQILFNDEFDFIPKGKELIIDGYKAYLTEFIESVSFDDYCRFSDIKDIDKLIKQTNVVLDKLNEKKIVHCDLESVNVLIQKKTDKMFIIDFDTCCSEKFGLYCAPDAFPGYTIKQHLEDCIIYDDAYSFYELFKRYNFVGIEKLDSFNALKNKIGRNIHKTPIVGD